jgi:peptidoglycan/xylan/chitin deacetylase (PgdA/CDA1 family)
MRDEALCSEENITHFNAENWMIQMIADRIITGNRNYPLSLSRLLSTFNPKGLTSSFIRARSGVAKWRDNLLAAKKISLGIVMLLILSSGLCEAKVQGGLVLAFDDGYPDWVTTIAPELARVGGVATCFPTLNSIRLEKITYEDLRKLQNHYGWEIGTHTYHHYNAADFVNRKGMSAWVRNELEAGAKELRAHGLNVRSMVFPYDVFTPELCREVRKRFETYRDPELFFIAPGLGDNGPIPGREMDTAQFVPLELIFKWIDLAHDRGALLFLFGHQVLPDAEFQTGTVEAVSQHTLIAKDTLRPSAAPDLYLVPDTSCRFSGNPIRVVQVEGNKIQAGRGDLARLTKPGATFMIGPGYGTRLSDFRKMIAYAAQRLKFYTVHQVVGGQWRKN